MHHRVRYLCLGASALVFALWGACKEPGDDDTETEPADTAFTSDPTFDETFETAGSTGYGDPTDPYETVETARCRPIRRRTTRPR